MEERRGLQRPVAQRLDLAAGRGIWSLNPHGAVYTSSGIRIYDTGGIRLEHTGCDRDVTASALIGFSENLTLLQNYELWIDRNIPASSGPVRDRGADLTVDEMNAIDGTNINVATTRLLRLGRDGVWAISHIQPLTGIDFDVACFPWTSAAGGD